MHGENETEALNNLTTPKLCMNIYITMQQHHPPTSSMFVLSTNEPLVGHDQVYLIHYFYALQARKLFKVEKTFERRVTWEHVSPENIQN